MNPWAALALVLIGAALGAQVEHFALRRHRARLNAWADDLDNWAELVDERSSTVTIEHTISGMPVRVPHPTGHPAPPALGHHPSGPPALVGPVAVARVSATLLIERLRAERAAADQPSTPPVSHLATDLSTAQRVELERTRREAAELIESAEPASWSAVDTDPRTLTTISIGDYLERSSTP